MYTKVKGTQDFLPEQAKKLTGLENYLRDIASLYGYSEIRVPILQNMEVIHRSSGESSDIVTKETFDFPDRGNRMLTLRPEGTAPVIRAVIENKLYTRPLPLKLFYMGDMFRYERPQKGRYREFNQFGVEVVGTNSPYIDAECIVMASTIFKSLRINNFKVRLNTLGDNESRTRYKEALKEYFKDKLDSLCNDCKNRYSTNPLRILDCKVDKDNEVLLNAPKISDYLSEESKKEFEVVKNYLDKLNVPYVVDLNLVRGLDYYTNTIFEFEIDGGGAGQSLTICAGGRYNDLVKMLDGPDLGCVGFAFGLERLSDIIDERVDYTHKVICQFVPMDDSARDYLIEIMQDVRISGISSDMYYEKSGLKVGFKAAENNKAKFIVIAGENEISNNQVTIKVKSDDNNRDNDIQETINKDMVAEYIIATFKSHRHKCETCDNSCDNCNR